MAKTINTRVQLKHDTEANWLKATNFTPLTGEIIIYDPDDNNPLPRLKIGDGSTNVNNLPFVSHTYIQSTAPENVPVGTLWIDTSVVSTVAAEEVSF